MRMLKMEVTRLRDPMSRVPVFKEPQPQQLDKPMIFESGYLKLNACLQKRTNCRGCLWGEIIFIGVYKN